MASASELEYQILFACDVGLVEEEEPDRLTREVVKVKRMLNALLKKLRANS